jgi:hypothetical protein
MITRHYTYAGRQRCRLHYAYPIMLNHITTAALPCKLQTAEEHQLRLKAEADALDKATRLQVAQEQLAEYASEKSQAAAAVLQHAEAVEAALAALAAAGSSGSGQVSGELLQQVAALKQQLADAALEAQAFSEQQQADVERLKRSSQQVRTVPS